MKNVRPANRVYCMLPLVGEAEAGPAPKELPLRTGSPSGLNRCQRVTKCMSQGPESVFRTLTVSNLCFGENAFVVGLSGFEHVVDDAGQFVGSSSDRFRGTEAGSHATVEFAERGFTFLKRLSGHSQGEGNPILDLSCPCPQHLSTADVIVRT